MGEARPAAADEAVHHAHSEAIETPQLGREIVGVEDERPMLTMESEPTLAP